jgi:outer membrane protein assembly factor BamB
MKKALLAVAAAVLLIVGTLVGYGVYKERQGKDVRGSSTEEFDTTREPAPKPRPAAAKIRWPMYRFDASRQGNAERMLVEPPYRPIWFFRARSLVEFPPSVAYGRLYFANADGTLFALDLKRKKPTWTYRARRCTAATPAIDGHTVYMAYLNKPPCNATRSGLDGEVVALNADTGKLRWRVKLAPTESSPLVVDGTVYVGDWSGRVYALSAATGATRWTFKTGDKVKDAMAYAGGRIYFGSYDHHVYALNARSGKLFWRAAAQQRLGPRGRFYSTPAVAYGRVYIGSTDGKVYSYGATSGKLRWSHGTGDYVYSSPAIWKGRVYAGSYDGTMYAFDGATGDVLWKYKANGAISGSPIVISDVLYFSTLKGRTYALDPLKGKLLWAFRRGSYAAVVSDRRRLYLVAHARIFAMAPRKRG